MKDGKYVILYVDDDQDMLDSIRTVLESAGYIMIEARSGEEGIKVYRENNPDFIIVDLMMEEFDSGISLVKEINRAGVTAPVYMLSSVGDQFDSLTDRSELGLSGVFQKPINVQVLLQTIKNHLHIS
ncbi:MAG TPA: response regulator [Thermodesulfobacteriota bacterium]|nr:response regulator [Deltaproteobacteria bacterium]HNR13307.1 response regulator [Thermodesulfobacteriota bacterium]HNU72675.1 response regulator [Thermodesulfobacteriota bacterium]HQN18650.1 response regulator [Syntrophobacteraceae bacterium]HQO77246.1 response regulator [Thermodesulfobacteriota bacterium]